jgi:DNA-binding LacI/PurR family transcriptional regulator
VIVDIARRARVSPATVSRAINQPALVAAGRLLRVRQAIAELHYVPAEAPRRRGPKSRLAEVKRIGVWFVGAKRHSSFNWFRDHMLQSRPAGGSDRIELSVLFSDTPGELPRAIADRQVDGVIIQGMEPSPAVLARLGDLPRVWFMTRRSTEYSGDYVEPDNDANGRLAAEYLQSRGRRVVAVIAADPSYSAVAWRVRAFLARAQELGLTTHSILGKPKPTSFLSGAPVHEESEWLARRLAQAVPRTDGLYLPVDHFCGSLFRSLRLAGLPPGAACDAVLGNYNPTIYHNLDNQPAALDINLPLLISRVTDHLVWRIQNPGMPGRIGLTVSPTLISAEAAARRLTA